MVGAVIVALLLSFIALVVAVYAIEKMQHLERCVSYLMVKDQMTCERKGEVNVE